MIFFDGEIYENDMCDKLLARFEDRICDTLGNCRLSAQQVMLAAEKISTDIENGAFDDMLSALDVENVSYYKQLILACLSRENLEYRLKTELGDSDGFIGSPNGITPKIKNSDKTSRRSVPHSRRKCRRLTRDERCRRTSCRQYQYTEASVRR